MKAIRIFILLLSFIVFLPNFGVSQKVKKIVIDAGHGGKDPGAIGATKKREKDIVLPIALKTGYYLKKFFPDIEIVYTRESDNFLELYERSTIANEEGADLFVSIHANSNNSSSPHGSETYVLGLHRTEANLDVAKRENAVIELEDDANHHYSFNPNSPEGHIMMSMAQNAYLDQSILLANKVQNEFQNRAKRTNRGVKQAGFWVLYKTTMPSILIELGFLSNPEEERYLSSEEGQEYMASAIYRAIKEYKIEVDKLWEENENIKQVKTNNTNTKDKTTEDKDKLYRIQVYASKKQANKNAKVYKDFSEVYVEPTSKGVYRYVINSYDTYELASQDLINVVKKGYEGAYIVLYKNGVRAQIFDVTSTN